MLIKLKLVFLFYILHIQNHQNLVTIILFERHSDKERGMQGDRDLLFTSSLSEGPQRSGLNQGETKSQALCMGLQHRSEEPATALLSQEHHQEAGLVVEWPELILVLKYVLLVL